MCSKKIFFLTLLTFSCISHESSLYQIDPDKWVEKTFLLSNIADDIVYIPIDDSIPVNVLPPPRVQILNNSVFISVGIGSVAEAAGIVKYNKSGRLISKIGVRGRGPGEYTSWNFTVDYKTGIIYILDNDNKIKIYSENGNFIREIPLKKFGDNFDKVDVYSSKLIVSSFLRYGESEYDWIVLDTLGNLITAKKNTVPPFKDNPGLSGTTYFYKNTLFYTNYYNDTVFSILPDLTYEPSFLFSQGEHRWPRGKVTGKTIPQYFFPLKLFETEKFIAFFFGHGYSRGTAFINKKTKETYLINNASQNYWISNDIDGGILFDPFSSSYYEENGREYLVGLIDTYNLKACISDEKFRGFSPRYPEKKNKLEKLANSLKETDNPVIMIVRLKK
jgi:hypothetical protein